MGVTGSPASVLQLEYGYGTTNNNGNVLTQTITAALSLSLFQDYSYDGVNRLWWAREGSGSIWRQTFNYDAHGYRTFDTANTTGNVQGPNPGPNSGNNQFNSPGYGYDSSGNLQNMPYVSLSYDAENRQTAYTNTSTGITASYNYDGDGRRVKSVVNGATTIFVYDAFGKLIAEYGSPQTGRSCDRVSSEYGGPKVGILASA